MLLGNLLYASQEEHAWTCLLRLLTVASPMKARLQKIWCHSCDIQKYIIKYKWGFLKIAVYPSLRNTQVGVLWMRSYECWGLTSDFDTASPSTPGIPGDPNSDTAPASSFWLDGHAILLVGQRGVQRCVQRCFQRWCQHPMKNILKNTSWSTKHPE